MKLLLILSTLFSLILSAPLSAKEYSFEELLECAKKHPEVEIESAQVALAENDINKINGEMLPKISLLAGLGPNYTRKGNALASTRSDDINAISYLANIKVQIPVFAFNRAGDYTTASKNNVLVKKIDIEKKQAEMSKKLKEYYFGFQYASNLHRFAQDTIADLTRALTEMEKSKAKNAESDFEKLTIFKSLATTKLFEIEKGLEQAQIGLKFITSDPEATIAQDWIEFNPRELPPLSDLLAKLEETNFDLRQAKVGLIARESLVTAEKKAYLPVFGIFAEADLRHTPKSESQQSVFAYDPFNRSDITVGFGFMWDIDFGIKKSNVEAASIEFSKLQRQMQYAKNNLPLKVQVAYSEVVEAQKKIEELERSYKLTKKMVTRIASGIALGLVPAKEIIDSYTMRAEMYQQLYESIYKYELRLADLSYELGTNL